MNKLPLQLLQVSNGIGLIALALVIFFTYKFYADVSSNLRIVFGLLFINTLIFGLIAAICSFALALFKHEAIRQSHPAQFYIAVSLAPCFVLCFTLYKLIEAKYGLIG